MKRNTLFLSALTLLATFCIIHSAPAYPFPQNVLYPYGTIADSSSNEIIQSAYQVILDNYYEERGDLARMKWDDPSQTVSEGIAYGMLIMVYMDNSQNNTQGKFDKLWNYYKKFPDKYGLMNWKINGFSGVAENGHNAATDAELDAAIALLMAYKQWGNNNYLNEAKDLIGKIWQHEVNERKYLKPGDGWDDKKNPSYFSTVALELFKIVDNGHDWSTVINNSYSLLKASRNGSTGLVPDWCTEQGGALGNYSYDATRTPWRMAWAYAWFGHSDAKDIASKIAGWITTKTSGDASKILDGYLLDGTVKASENICAPAFLGPFACAGLVDTVHKAWLNNATSKLNGKKLSYYNDHLAIISLLLLTGNMPNFWNPPLAAYALKIVANPPSAGTITLTPASSRYTSGSQVQINCKPTGNYVFTNWSGDITGTENSKTITLSKNMTITANFASVGVIKTGYSAIRSRDLQMIARHSQGEYIFSYTLSKPEKVSSAIFTIDGREIVNITNGIMAAGNHQMTIRESILKASGSYIFRLSRASGTDDIVFTVMR
jgi:endo-1,4-beta-D-glucanase Y